LEAPLLTILIGESKKKKSTAESAVKELIIARNEIEDYSKKEPPHQLTGAHWFFPK
jgi:hypothetical protein